MKNDDASKIFLLLQPLPWFTNKNKKRIDSWHPLNLYKNAYGQSDNDHIDVMCFRGILFFDDKTAYATE